MNSFKYTLGVIVGTISAMILTFALEFANMYIYPIPAGYTMQDMSDKNKMKEMMQHMPTGAFVSVLLIYAIASYIGGIIGTYISGRDKNWPAIVIGIFMFGIGLWNGMEYAHPIWFMAGCFACVPFAWYGYYCVKKKTISMNK